MRDAFGPRDAFVSKMLKLLLVEMTRLPGFALQCLARSEMVVWVDALGGTDPHPDIQALLKRWLAGALQLR